MAMDTQPHTDLILAGRIMNYKIIIVFFLAISALHAQTISFSEHNERNEIALMTHFKTDSLQQAGQPKKSPGKAFFFSLLLPGSGEYYAGAKKSAAFFAATEALLWVGMFANDVYQRELVRDYKTYAVAHAAVDRAGKEYQYWIDIGKYDDIYSFNEQRRQDRYFEALYEENQANYWMWDSKENRLTYDEYRLHANKVAIRAVYFQAAAMLNHFVSAIHAMYRVRQFNRREAETVWNLHFDSPALGFGETAFRANFSLSF